MRVIVTSNLTKRFGKLTAVNRINLSIEEGEMFGLLGPNGAGKTTMIKILTTLIQPTSGSATVNGNDTVKNPNAVKREIGWVASEVILDDDLTVLENLKLQADLQGINEWRKMADSLLKYFGIEDFGNARVGTLSTGMRKKLEISEALLGSPKIIFMDEPTIGLDVGTRSMLWDLIKKIREDNKVTIFLTTHYMEEADELCDRIAIISKGVIAAIGTPEALKSKVGGDVLELTVTNNFYTNSIKSLKWKRNGNVVRIELRRGKDSVVSVLKKINLFEVDSLKLIRPSLDTAFMKITGSTMAEQETHMDMRKFYAQIRRARQ